MMALYLDDERDCPQGFTLARTVEDALSLTGESAFEILSLDHDMGFDVKACKLAKTGYDYVTTLCDPTNDVIKKQSLRAIFLHTQNPVGRERMYKALLNAQQHGFLSSSIRVFPYAPHEGLIYS